MIATVLGLVACYLWFLLVWFQDRAPYAGWVLLWMPLFVVLIAALNALAWVISFGRTRVEVVQV